MRRPLCPRCRRRAALVTYCAECWRAMKANDECHRLKIRSAQEAARLPANPAARRRDE